MRERTRRELTITMMHRRSTADYGPIVPSFFYWPIRTRGTSTSSIKYQRGSSVTFTVFNCFCTFPIDSCPPTVPTLCFERLKRSPLTATRIHGRLDGHNALATIKTLKICHNLQLQTLTSQEEPDKPHPHRFPCCSYFPR